MDLKVLMLILFYYSMLSMIILSAGASIGDASLNGTSTALNTSSFDESEMKVGVFGSGISFGRFVGLVTIGVGLPSDTPSWASTIFLLWQSAFLLFTIGFIISAVWNG